jgi:hypothetical protein
MFGVGIETVEAVEAAERAGEWVWREGEGGGIGIEA